MKRRALFVALVFGFAGVACQVVAGISRVELVDPAPDSAPEAAPEAAPPPDPCGHVNPPAIPDNDATGISNSIEVPEAGMIKALTVNVDVTHTYKGDLTVELVRGTKVIALHNKAGGSADDIKAAFALTDFLNTDMAGTWTLRVKDTASIDVGTLNAWSLEITK